MGVFLLSLFARLAFFFLMFHEVDASRWIFLTPDSAHYSEAAVAIADNADFSSLGVQTFGPGYPFFLALLSLIAGSDHSLMMLFQIILSAAVSSLMAWWSLKLTGERRIAWIAGILNALSITAVSLANIFLSETLFMALTLLGGLVLLYGMNSGKYTVALCAGLLFGIATLTRSMGIALPLVLISLCLLGEAKSTCQRLRFGLVALFISLVIPIGWHFLSPVGESKVTGAVPSAMARIVRAIDASDHRISRKQATANFAIECLKHADDSTGDFFRSERLLANRRFQQLLAERPDAVVLTLARNMRDNMTNEFGTIAVQIPSLASTYETIRIFSAKKGLNHRVLLFALIGALILLIRQQWKLCLPLVLIFCYFAVMSGFSDSQTSRIFYPAQMAWGVLVSVTLLTMYDWVGKRWSGRGQRLTS